MIARAWIVGDTPRQATNDEAAAALGQAALVWVHLDGNDAATPDWLAARKLDPLVVRALTATETRPRTEGFDDGAIVNLRGPDRGEGDHPDLLASVRMWIAEGRVFSVSLRPLAALDKAEEKVAAGKIRDPGDLVVALAAAITAQLDPDVAALGDTLDDCEEDLRARTALTMRRVIAKTRSRAIAYRRFIAPQRAALERLGAIEADWLAEDDRRHLAEAADRAARMAEELEAIRERAALMHEQLTDLRAELIDTRSLVIAVVALVFLPLTFLTGLFGMNVRVPWEGDIDGFWIVCGASAALALGVSAWFIRARWFR